MSLLHKSWLAAAIVAVAVVLSAGTAKRAVGRKFGID